MSTGSILGRSPTHRRRSIISLPEEFLQSRPDLQNCLDMAQELEDRLDDISRMDVVGIVNLVRELLNNLNTASPETLRDTLQGLLLHYSMDILESRAEVAMA